MYERLLDKSRKPELSEIYESMGDKGVALFEKLEDFLTGSYSLLSELRFPFGNNYGWGMKYSHNYKHLCYAFFENGAFTVMIQIGKNEISKLYEKLPQFSQKTNELWKKRYPCGNGGWLHYRILTESDLNDIIELIIIKKSPLK